MADNPGIKITALSSLPSAAANDLLPIVDVSDTSASPEGTTKHIEVSKIVGIGSISAIAIEDNEPETPDDQGVIRVTKAIPINGTKEGHPFSGRIDFTGAMEILTPDTGVSNGLRLAGDLFDWSLTNSSTGYLKRFFISLTEGFVYYDDDPQSRGIRGFQDFTANVQDFDYVQKKFVVDRVGIVEIDYNGLNNLVTQNTVIAGQLYKLTGTTGQSSLYVDIFLRGLTTNSISPSGIGMFVNADYQNKGDYSGVYDKIIVWAEDDFGSAEIGRLILYEGKLYVNTTTAYINHNPTTNNFPPVQMGVWSVELETAGLYTNNVVIWNGVHWKVNSSENFDGTNPAINSNSYEMLPYDSHSVSNTSNVGYVKELDIVEYDFANDWLVRRKDKRGNDFSQGFIDNTSSFTEHQMQFFQWGNDNATSNKIINASFVCRNNAWKIVDNDLQQQAVLNCDENKGSVNRNKFSFGTTTEIVLQAGQKVSDRNYDGSPFVWECFLTCPDDTHDPNPILKRNQLGSSYSVTRQGVGTYYLFIPGAFNPSRVISFLQLLPSYNDATISGEAVGDGDNYKIVTCKPFGNPADGLLFNHFIRAEVLP